MLGAQPLGGARRSAVLAALKGAFVCHRLTLSRCGDYVSAGVGVAPALLCVPLFNSTTTTTWCGRIGVYCESHQI
eukprot:scaffold24321_cov119-Isochrysis_galbana.AAC.2